MNEELINYIKENLAKGVPKNQIRQNLINSGWQQTDIDAAFLQSNPQSPQTPQIQLKEQKSFLNPKILFIIFIAFLILIGGGVGTFFAIQKIKPQTNQRQAEEQRIIYALKIGQSASDYLGSEIEIYSTKLDGTDKKLVANAKKDDLILLNSRIWPFYDAVILRGQNTPFTIIDIDNEGNDLRLRYKPDNFEFGGYVLDFAAPSLSPDGKKVAFILNGDKGFGSNLKTCSSGSGCFINIRDIQTGQITTAQIKFDVWSLGEFLTIGWTQDQKYILGTGCNTTGCTIDGFETHSTWAINLETQETKIYGEGGSPPFLLPGTSKFVYSSYDPRCKGDPQYPLSSRCAMKLVNLENGQEKTLAYNENVSLTPIRFVPNTKELFFIEAPNFNPNSNDFDPVKYLSSIFPLKSIKIDSSEVETSTLTPIISGETIFDVSANGEYVIFSKKDNNLNRIMSKNLKTGQEYQITENWSEYIGLFPETVKRAKTGLLSGRAINLSLPKLPVDSPTSTKTADQPTQPTLEGCAVIQSRSLFPNTLTFKNAEYSKQGQPIYNELNYVNGPDSIKLSVIKKENNKELYETLRKSIQTPATLGEGSERNRKNIHGEDVLFTVAKHTTGNYNWSIAVNISDQIIVLFQGPTKPSKVEMSSIEALFNNWFQNVC